MFPIGSGLRFGVLGSVSEASPGFTGGVSSPPPFSSGSGFSPGFSTIGGSPSSPGGLVIPGPSGGTLGVSPPGFLGSSPTWNRGADYSGKNNREEKYFRRWCSGSS